MKLTALNTAIRKKEGPPMFDLRFFVCLDDGQPCHEVILNGLEITKQSLLAALKAAFPDGGRSTETGLRLNPTTGHLEREPADGEEVAEVAADDLDDILGGDAPAAVAVDPMEELLG